MKTLLEKAQGIKTFKKLGRKYSKEEMQLARAWFEDKIRLIQVSKAIETKTGVGIYIFLSCAYKQYLSEK